MGAGRVCEQGRGSSAVVKTGQHPEGKQVNRGETQREGDRDRVREIEMERQRQREIERHRETEIQSKR